MIEKSPLGSNMTAFITYQLKNTNMKITAIMFSFIAVLFACQKSLQISAQTNGGSVSVVMTTNAGDRLTSKPGLSWGSGYNAAAPIITVDPGITNKTIDGFGAAFLDAGMICINSLDSASRGNVLTKLFDPVNGSDFSCIKTFLGACDFTCATGSLYSYDDSVGDVNMNNFSISHVLGPNSMIPYIKLAKQYSGNFKLTTTMNYSSNWMMYDVKSNQDLLPRYYDALALYQLKYVEAYQANGIFIDYLSPFNETYMGNMSYVNKGKYIENNLGPLFRSSGTQTKIMGGEPGGSEGLPEIATNIMNTEAAQYISAVSYHGYDEFFTGSRYDLVVAFHTKYPNTPLWMTELCYVCPSPIYDFSDGESWGKRIYQDLNTGASAWIYWNMILDQNGGPWLVSIVNKDPDLNNQHAPVIINRSTGAVTYTALYYCLSHFSKFVRPGFIAIASNPSWLVTCILSLSSPRMAIKQ
jgi:glucosylceramidase